MKLSYDLNKPLLESFSSPSAALSFAISFSPKGHAAITSNQQQHSEAQHPEATNLLLLAGSPSCHPFFLPLAVKTLYEHSVLMLIFNLQPYLVRSNWLLQGP